MAQHVLITGGAGFIGSHLSEMLLAKGFHVSIIDNLSTGKVSNIQHLKVHPNFTYIFDDIENIAVLRELIDECDVIFHLAATVGVFNIIESPIQTILNNVNGTERVLALAAVKGKRTIIASTSEVYGKSAKLPFNENDDLVLGPSVKARWSYACSKLLDEFLAIAYYKERGLPTTVLRFFNTVGPRQSGRYGMVIPTFVRQALQHSSITVFGNGEQRRCFCHVADVVTALSLVLDNESTIGEVINIGNETSISILQVAELIKSMAASDSEIVTIPYNQAYAEGFEDMMQRVPDLSKARAIIGFENRYSLEQIISDVIEYERKNLFH